MKIINKGIIAASLLMAFGATQAQVGVDTEQPTETLNVNGTVRINELPENGTTAAIHTTEGGTKSATKDQTFKATKTVVADANGVLGTINGTPESYIPKNDFKEVAEINIVNDENIVDGIEIHTGCLYARLDPIDGTPDHVDLKLKVDTTCVAARNGEVFTAMSATGGDRNDSYYTSSNRLFLNSNNFVSDGFTDRAMSYSPIIYGRIALVDLHQVYEYTYYTHWNDLKAKYQMGLTLKRIQ